MRGREREQGWPRTLPALVRMNRWVILAGYTLLTACTQLLWLAYAPITTQTHHIMGVSSAAVGDLAVIFPLMYVILALPAGRWLDARFAQALGLDACTAGGLLRLAGPSLRVGRRRPVRDRGRPAVRPQLDHQGRRPVLPGQGTDGGESPGSVALSVGILAAVLSGGPLLDAGGPGRGGPDTPAVGPGRGGGARRRVGAGRGPDARGLPG